MKTMTILAAILMTLTTGALAGTWYTMPGDTLTTDGGYPWVSTDTNFNAKLMTSQSGPVFTTNAAGTGEGMLGLTYDNFEQFGQVTVSGAIGAGDLNFSTSSYMQIGLVTEAMVKESENWYLSGMFNDSIMVTIWEAADGHKINITDYNLGGGRRSASMSFDNATDLLYELTLDFNTDIASLVIDNGAGWSAPVTTQFGTSDWGANGQTGDHNPEDFSSAALFANMYNESAGLNAVASFGDVSVTPEPATMGLLGLGAIALIRRRK